MSATEVKFRRGTSAEHNSFVGATGEITVDTTKNTLVAHDGSTTGGFPMLREDLNNLSIGTGLSKASGTLSLDADDIFFRQDQLLGEIATGDQNTAIGNLGITATKTELNILDGATLSTAELNQLDGNVFTETLEINDVTTSILAKNSADTFTFARFRGNDDTQYGRILVRDVSTSPYLDFSDFTSFRFRTSVRLDDDLSMGDNVVIDSSRNITATLGTFATGAGTLFIEQFGGGSVKLRSDAFLRLESNSGSGVRLYTGDDLILEATSTGIDVTGTGTFSDDLTAEANLFVNGGLFASEFVVNRTRVLTDFAMSAGGKIGSIVTATAGSEVITFEDENGSTIEPFGVNDILHIQVTTGATNGTIVKNIWRKVDSISSSQYTLTDTGITWATGTDDVGTIAVGDSVVRKGNTAGTTDRDHYIKFDISGNGGVEAPTVTVFDNVTDVNDDGDIRLMYGKLDGKYGIGASAEEFGFAAGDSALTNNHIVLTPSTTKFQLDTFRLNTTGLDIDSSVPSITSTGTNGESTLTEGVLRFDKVSGTGSIRADISDSNGVRLDVNGANYKVARFQEGANPIIGVLNTYTGSSGGAANALPANPVAYVPVEIADESTGTVNLYVYPVYDPASVPSAPSNVSLCAATSPDDGIQISWDAVAVSDSYKVEREDPDFGWVEIYDNTSTSYVDTFAAGINSGNTYTYRVFTVDDGVTSSPSSEVSGEYDNLGAC